MYFRSGAVAETAARSLGTKMACAGAAVEIQIFFEMANWGALHLHAEPIGCIRSGSPGQRRLAIPLGIPGPSLNSLPALSYKGPMRHGRSPDQGRKE
jgi:hypothetical protein